MTVGLNGMVPVGEYGSMHDARLAAAILERQGIEAVLPYGMKGHDPDYGPRRDIRGTQGVFVLLVSAEVADRARDALGNYQEIAEEPPPGFRDEDLSAWVEDLHQREVRQRESNERFRRRFTVALSLLCAAMIGFALYGLALGHG